MSENQLSAMTELLLRKDAEIAGLKERCADIVRCGECMCRKTRSCATHYETSNGEFWFLEDDNDFCSFGKRKETGK